MLGIIIFMSFKIKLTCPQDLRSFFLYHPELADPLSVPCSILSLTFTDCFVIYLFLDRYIMYFSSVGTLPHLPFFYLAQDSTQVGIQQI